MPDVGQFQALRTLGANHKLGSFRHYKCKKVKGCKQAHMPKPDMFFPPDRKAKVPHWLSKAGTQSWIISFWLCNQRERDHTAKYSNQKMAKVQMPCAWTAAQTWQPAPPRSWALLKLWLVLFYCLDWLSSLGFTYDNNKKQRFVCWLVA